MKESKRRMSLSDIESVEAIASMSWSGESWEKSVMSPGRLGLWGDIGLNR